MSIQNPFSRLRIIVLLAVFGLAFFALVPQAQARPLDAPRIAGQVGERFDGYAVVRGNQPAAIAALVDQTNAERRALYTDRAKKEGVPVLAIGKIYAAEIVKSAPAKTWFLSESGQWTQK